jgi:hypothetical protein
MHFGLTNTPATFQLFMNNVFHDLLDKFLGGYLDGLIIFTETDSDNLRLHISQVREVLTRLRANKLYANPKKCTFHVYSVEFLGYIVAKNGLTMDTAKTDAIASWPTPKNVKDIQSFLGFANFYWRFIYNYSAIVKPLTNLTRKDTPFIWSLESTNAFENLKKALLRLRYWRISNRTTKPLWKLTPPTMQLPPSFHRRIRKQNWSIRSPSFLGPWLPRNSTTKSTTRNSLQCMPHSRNGGLTSKAPTRTSNGSPRRNFSLVAKPGSRNSSPASTSSSGIVPEGLAANPMPLPADRTSILKGGKAHMP